MKGLSDLKKLLALFSITLLLHSSDELVDVLSNNKSRLIEAQKKQTKLQAEKLERSWINPIIVQYSKNYSTQFDKTIDTGQFVISVDQPIFKMGGIWEAVKYAKALGEANSLDIEIKKRELITQALSILYNLKKSKLKLQKLDLLIRNDELDILIQKESYKAGLSNRTLYDRALLKRNQDITSKLELQMQIIKLKNDFSLLSDKNPEDISLPYFTMLDKSRYENSQLEIQRDILKAEAKEHNKYMTWTKYLPELSVTGRYVNEDKNPLFANAKIKKSYYTYGFKVSLPININAYRDIESSQIEYLNAQINLDEQ
jgi:outer membrane protein TolC